MIQLKQNASNQFVIYADTISNDIQEFGDYFLIGFQNGFTKKWSYVVPTILRRNTRFIECEILVVPSLPEEDPLTASVYLAPSMNWTYKVWNTDEATLDPVLGKIIDQGQMILENQVVPEVQYTAYTGGNQNLRTFVYYSANGIWNNTAQLWNFSEMLWNG